ncbi:MAG: EamA family transporter [Pseudomonadaceae bacterium]|nr:EamA family transporter [Pseudomonadaceae bacterium]
MIHSNTPCALTLFPMVPTMHPAANISLLFTVVLAWGFSWYAIALQVGPIPVEASIAYRFVASGVLLLMWCAFKKGRVAVPAHLHLLLALMGVTLFSLNFILLYSSTAYIVSGITSVVFAGASLMGAFNAWMFDRVRPSPRVLLGALVGVSGLALLFASRESVGGGGPTLATDVDGQILGATSIGLLLALAGTYCFSLGNIISSRVLAHTDVITGTAWAMSYGGLFAILASVANHGTLSLPPLTLSYFASLFYLIVGASLIGFLSYLELIRRTGVSRAAYATVLFPVVALAMSSWLEGYAWTLQSILGIAAILCGAVLVFARAPSRDGASPSSAA